MSVLRTLTAALLAAGATPVLAQGISPYLPLQLSQEIESQVAQLLINAGEPQLSRPVRAATIKRALSRGCTPDPALCARVRSYLNRYMSDYGLSHAAAKVRYSDAADEVLANQRGERSDSSYSASLGAYWQPHAYLLVNGGALAYEGELQPEGSYVSLGAAAVRLDVGYRPHWLSPLVDSALLLGTQAPTMPSISLSNDLPLTRWGLGYELVVGQLESSTAVSQLALEDARLAAMQLQARPLPRLGLSYSALSFYDAVPVGDGLWAQPEQQAVAGQWLGTDALPLALSLEWGRQQALAGNPDAQSMGVALQWPNALLGWTLDAGYSQWQRGWAQTAEILAHEGQPLGLWPLTMADDAGHSTLLGAERLLAGGSLLRLEARVTDADEHSAGWQLGARYSRGLRYCLAGVEAAWRQPSAGADGGASLGLFVRW